MQELGYLTGFRGAGETMRAVDSKNRIADRKTIVIRIETLDAATKKEEEVKAV